MSATAVPQTTATMRAMALDGYGPPERLELRELERPQLDADGVLVRVRAVALNPVDWHMMRGEPFLARLMAGLRGPQDRVPGLDLVGEVEGVGANVTELRPGDEVFGTCSGALAEYASGTQESFVPKPATLSWEQAAAISVAGRTALQAVRDHGQLQPGQSVLINGASGGVGTFAVQIARALGGEVTGVCSTRNVELVRSLGADHVVDYSAEDFTRCGRRYDLVLQVCGNPSFRALRRALAPRGTLVLVGAGTGRAETADGLLGALAVMIRGRVLSWFVRQRFRMFLAKRRREDLLFLAQLIEAGELTPVVDRSYPLAEAAEALRYVEAGHARGKVVVTI